jgi:hypothetical protein
MKRLMVFALIAVGAGTLAGCVDVPGDVVVVRHSGYYYSDPGYYGGGYYYRDRGYYPAPRYYRPRQHVVPGYYDRHGRWHRGHWR